MKNSRALKQLKFQRAEGRAVSDDLRPKLRTVRHTACLLRIFGRFCMRLQNHVCLENEFFNRIGHKSTFDRAASNSIKRSSRRSGHDSIVAHGTPPDAKPVARNKVLKLHLKGMIHQPNDGFIYIARLIVCWMERDHFSLPGVASVTDRGRCGLDHCAARLSYQLHVAWASEDQWRIGDASLMAPDSCSRSVRFSLTASTFFNRRPSSV